MPKTHSKPCVNALDYNMPKLSSLGTRNTVHIRAIYEPGNHKHTYKAYMRSWSSKKYKAAITAYTYKQQRKVCL